MADDTAVFEGWAIIELMGHRRLAGWVSEIEIAGKGMLRLDVPGEIPSETVEGPDTGEWEATQFYSPAALYCLTPVTGAMARGVAARNRPEPVARWELPERVGEDVAESLPEY
jgi:hypothetical protein